MDLFVRRGRGLVLLLRSSSGVRFRRPVGLVQRVWVGIQAGEKCGILGSEQCLTICGKFFSLNQMR